MSAQRFHPATVAADNCVETQNKTSIAISVAAETKIQQKKHDEKNISFESFVCFINIAFLWLQTKHDDSHPLPLQFY